MYNLTTTSSIAANGYVDQKYYFDALIVHFKLSRVQEKPSIEA